MMASNDFQNLEIRLQTGDTLLRTLLQDAQTPLQPLPTLGTLVILNFSQLIDRLKPFFEQRIGSKAASLFTPAEHNGLFTFTPETPQVDKPTATQTIFGHPQYQHPPQLPKEILPAPTLWYGINYV